MRVLFFSLLCGLTSAVSAQQERPNVLFIAVDDLAVTLGCYGDELAVTPNIDALAERGTAFLNNHCQQAVCGPSRASVMTGMYPGRSKIWDFGIQMRDVLPDHPTIPQHFKNNGWYANGMGKMYDGRNADGWNSQDVASWSERYYQPWPSTARDMQNGYYDPDTVQAIRDFTAGGGNIHGIRGRLFPAVEQHINRPDSNYVDGSRADFAVQKVGELATSDTPFFLAVGFDKPHLPFVAPTRYWDLYDREDFTIASYQQQPAGSEGYMALNSGELQFGYDLPEGNVDIPEEKQLELIHGYYACVSFVDAQIGRIMAALDATGEADNTIIVLWSDHGFHLGDHRLWTKHNVLDRSTLSPLIISAPNQAQRGTKVENPSELVDIYPTLCELAGLPRVDGTQGMSLVPQLNDPTAKVRDFAASQYEHRDWSRPGGPYRMGYSIRDRRYRYTVWKAMDWRRGEFDGPIIGRELFDYANDPLETVNQVANPDFADIVAGMERQRVRLTLGQEPHATFAAPQDLPLEPIDETYSNVFVLTSNDLSLPELTNLDISWDGIDQFSATINVGGLQGSFSRNHTLDSAGPTMRINVGGDSPLNQTYYVTPTKDGLALVAEDGMFTLLATNQSEVPPYDPEVRTAFQVWTNRQSASPYKESNPEFSEMLMSYALGKDALTVEELSQETIDLSHGSARPDITYSVQSSQNLEDWEPLSEPQRGGNVMTDLEIARNGSSEFFSVKVEQ